MQATAQTRAAADALIVRQQEGAAVDESLRYSHPESMDRAPAEAILWSNDPPALCETLVSVALHDPDWAWVRNTVFVSPLRPTQAYERRRTLPGPLSGNPWHSRLGAGYAAPASPSARSGGARPSRGRTRRHPALHEHRRVSCGAACCLTRACSRRAGSVPSSARAQRPVRTKRNVGSCGRWHESPQLMRMSLGRHDGRPDTELP
jgi:hypothetical protein